MKQTEPYALWSNAAEAAIRVLTGGAGCQIAQSKSPNRLWDDSLERKVCVCSITAHNVYCLDGQVPDMLVSSETADISPLHLFRDTSVPYSDEAMILGRDLRPVIDVGPEDPEIKRSSGVSINNAIVYAR